MSDITTPQQFKELLHDFKCLCVSASTKSFDLLQLYNKSEIFRKVLYGDQVKLQNVLLTIPAEDLVWIFHTLYINDVTSIAVLLLDFNGLFIEHLRTFQNTPESVNFFVSIYFAENVRLRNKKVFAQRLVTAIWDKELLAEIIRHIEAHPTSKRNAQQRHLIDCLKEQRIRLENLDRQPLVVCASGSTEPEGILEYKFMEEAEKNDVTFSDSAYLQAAQAFCSLFFYQSDWTQEFKSTMDRLLSSINNEDFLYDAIKLQQVYLATSQDEKVKLNAQSAIAVICGRLEILENKLDLKQEERYSWTVFQKYCLDNKSGGSLQIGLGLFSSNINPSNLSQTPPIVKTKRLQ